MEQFPGGGAPYDQAQIPSAPYYQAQIPTGPRCQPSATYQPPPSPAQPSSYQQHQQQQYLPQSILNYHQSQHVNETVPQAYHLQPSQFHAQHHYQTSMPQATVPVQFPNQNNVAVEGIPVQDVTAVQITSVPAAAHEWNSGLFDCCNDPLNAIITILVPCLTFGQVAEIVDNGHTSCATSGILYCCIAYFIGCPCIFSCTYRSKLRGMFGIIESPAPDCITHCLCEWCALCQEYRELQSRGFDPSIGWHGNVAKIQRMQQQASMTPPTNQTMRM